MKMLRHLLLLATASLLASQACYANGVRLQVYTVNAPLAYLAERIGGDAVEVHFPAPTDIDPAFWMPDAETVAAYQQADVILLNGADYAKWVPRVSLPRHHLVNTSQAFSADYLEDHGAATHRHGPAGEHSHAGTAFTTWLDFSQAAQQADAIAAALSQVRPDQATAFERNLQVLQADLEALDNRLLELSRRHPGATLLASHPVYAYLARRYGLGVRAVVWEPEVYPDAASWSALRSLLAARPAVWMLWEDTPLEQTREQLASLGVQVVVFAPGMNVSPPGDFLELMQANVARLEAALDQGAAR